MNKRFSFINNRNCFFKPLPNHYIQNVIINYFKKGSGFVKVEKYKAGFVDLDVEGNDPFLIPAFTDSHIHLRALIALGYMVRVNDDSLLEDLNSSNKGIVIGRGWKKDFDLSILEELNRPTMAVRVCGHIAYCNESFKRQFGLKSKIIVENDLVNLFTRLDDLMLTKDSLKTAEEELKAKGIYRIIDMGSTPKLLNLLENSTLDYNLFFDLPYKDFVLKNGFKFGYKAYPNVKILGLKTYLDGSLGAKSAALFANDIPLNYTNKELYDLFKSMDENGLAVASHAIGDRAVRQFVSSVEGLKNHFHKVEHCQLVSKDDVDHLLNPGIQPYFYLSDRPWAKDIDYGRSLFYPLKSLLKSRPLGGSDFPVESFDPLQSIRAAVQRIDGEGIDMASAIDMYTKNPDDYLGEKLNKWLLVEDFYGDNPKIVKRVEL